MARRIQPKPSVELATVTLRLPVQLVRAVDHYAKYLGGSTDRTYVMAQAIEIAMAPLRANMRETVYPSEIREQGEEAKGLWTLHAGWMEDNRPWESRSEGAASEARRPAAEGLPRSSARRCPLGRSLRLTPR